MRNLRKKWKEDGGSVLMESVLLLPVFLLILMTSVQFAHIMFANYLTCYASYNAARSGSLAGNPSDAEWNALRSAKQVCSVLSLTASEGSTGTCYTLPWLGSVAGSEDLTKKVSVTCGGVAGEYFTAEVQMNFPLVVPVVNRFISGLMRWSDDVRKFELSEGSLYSSMTSYAGDPFPHIKLRSRSLMPQMALLAD